MPVNACSGFDIIVDIVFQQLELVSLTSDIPANSHIYSTQHFLMYKSFKEPMSQSQRTSIMIFPHYGRVIENVLHVVSKLAGSQATDIFSDHPLLTLLTGEC